MSKAPTRHQRRIANLRKESGWKVSELAAWARVDHSTVLRWIDKKLLKAVNHGERLWRISPAEVRFFKEHGMKGLKARRLREYEG